jgi:hypothetical protein
MRYLTISVALLLATIGTATPQSNSAPDQTRRPAQVPEGPISAGVYHQPSPAEIQQREHGSKADQQRRQRESKEVDELYNQLINSGWTPPNKP